MNINILREINEWWVTGSVRKDFLEPVPRMIIPEILEAMDDRQIILLEGARRVGKTSIIFHLIDDLIRQGISSKHLIYISLDDPLIEKEGFFEGLVKIIETYLLENRIQSSRERFYLFLDEVTHLNDWELFLKRYYDQKYPFKFIISSSASSFLVKKGKESLAGRLFRFNVTPFSFSEFSKLRGVNDDILILQKTISNLWKDFWEYPEIARITKGLEVISKKSALHTREMEINLHQFLLNGGFPEFLQLKGERLIRQYFTENVVERVLYYDIPEAFRLTDRVLLQNLMYYSIFHSGSIININEIAASFNATRQSVSEYLHYLQASMLVRLLEKYAKTEASRLRAFKKLYTIDSGLFVHLQRLSPAQVEERGIIGQLAEIAVFSQLNKHKGSFGHLFYFRERDAEVDFVIETQQGLVPVEVKYRETPKDIKGVHYFMQKFKAKMAIIITKDTFKITDNILYVPLSLFLS